jgi:hypothetical protein
MSVAPPGGKGTMKRTGFCGQDCAKAPLPSNTAAVIAMSFIF